MRALVTLQLAAIALLGAITVAKLQIFAEVDEAQHVAYVEEVAQHGRLPFLGHDLISPDLLAVSRGTYPRPAPLSPAQAGFGAISYEAFQPPLYYVLAVPAYLVAGDERAKVRVLRGFDVVLLLLAAGALWLLCRRAFPDDPLPPLCAGLGVLLLPGFVVRSVSVSNAALEVIAALLFLAMAWRADERRDRASLLVAGAVLGLALLAKTTLVYLVPVYAIVVLRTLLSGGRGRALTAVLAVAVPLLVLAPWTASNLDRYGSPTATSQARELQTPYLYRSEPDFGASDLADFAPRLLHGFLPQEWDQRDGLLSIKAIGWLLAIGLVAAPLVLLVTKPALLRSRAAILLGLPFALALATQVATLLLADWDIFLGRYLYPALAPLALLAAFAWRELARSRRVAVGITVGLSGLAAVAGLDGALTIWFPNVGGKLGLG